jgi:RNA polymerase sigma-70 factor (ECF subfamily)
MGNANDLTDEHLRSRRLIKRMLRHEEQAFTEFFDRYFARLYRFALVRLSDDTESAKEVVHVALTKAMQKLDSYRGEAGLFTWLCSICRNEINDHLSRLVRARKHIVLTEDYDDIRAIVESFESPANERPDDGFLRLEASRLIQVALDRLPSHYGDVLEWMYIYGFSAKEISVRLKIGLDATHSLIARAKRAFREVYSTLIDGLENRETAKP